MDNPRSEPRVLHELTQYKMAEDAEAILLFVLSTKTTAERFLLKLCQRNGNLKRSAIPGLFLAESSSEEDEKVSASEEEAVTETESASEIQENVESSYSDDSSADEAKRRKSAGKPNLRLRVRPSPNLAKRRRKNQINGTRVFRKKRWSESLFPGERRLILLQY